MSLRRTAIGCTVVTNSSSTALEITGLTSFDSVGGAFGLSQIDDSMPPVAAPVPVSIAGGASVEICFSFTPPISQDYNGQATLTSDDPDAVAPTLQLTGWGGGPQMTCSPLSIAFGWTLCHSATTIPILCTNTGTAVPGKGPAIEVKVVGPGASAWKATIDDSDPDAGPQWPRARAKLSDRSHLCGIRWRLWRRNPHHRARRHRSGVEDLADWLRRPRHSPLSVRHLSDFARLCQRAGGRHLGAALVRDRERGHRRLQGQRSSDRRRRDRRVPHSIDQHCGRPEHGADHHSRPRSGRDLEPHRDAGFRPDATRSTFSAEAAFSISDPSMPNQVVPLSGSSESTCLIVTPNTLNFGDAGVGDAGQFLATPSQSFSVSNQCQNSAQLESITLQSASRRSRFAVFAHHRPDASGAHRPRFVVELWHLLCADGPRRASRPAWPSPTASSLRFCA